MVMSDRIGQQETPEKPTLTSSRVGAQLLQGENRRARVEWNGDPDPAHAQKQNPNERIHSVMYQKVNLPPNWHIVAIPLLNN